VFETVNVPCQVCGGDQSQELFTLDFRAYRYPWPFVLRRCGGCGLLFNSPRLDAEGIRNLYGAGYYVFHQPARPEIRRTLAAYQRTVRLLEHPSGDLLEIGSAKGFMLALLRELGWRVRGVEISPQASSFARRRFGLDVYTGTIEQFVRQNGGRYDAVLAQDVLEHVSDPISFFRCLRPCLRPGGWLILDTPNGGARNIERVGPRWRGFNPFHVFLFSAACLRQIAEDHGFRVHRIASYNNVPPEESVTGRKKQLAAAKQVSAGPDSRRVRALLGPIAATLSRVGDSLLLSHYLHRAARKSRACAPAELHDDCAGDNLICLAQAPPERDRRPGTAALTAPG